jgi:hypothetical protein
MKKCIPVRLCTPDLPAFAERQNSYPFRRYSALKFGFFYSIRNLGDFRIAFLLKSGGAIGKTNFLKRFISILATKIPKEFSFKI